MSLRKPLAITLTILLQFASMIFAETVPSDAYQDLQWRLLGPLRAGWSTTGQGVPDDIETFYFGGADGGVWKTTDAGLTWYPISDQAPFSSVGSLAITSGNPRVIYVGTGQVDTRYDIMDGDGVYKTEDEGKTWTSLGLAETRHIGKILVDPRNPKMLLVAALGHVFAPHPERGVFRSEDGGANWQKVLFVSNHTGAVDLASDPETPDIVYAALWQIQLSPWLSYFEKEIGPESGIWKSTDGGKTWNQTSRKGLPDENFGRIGLAVAPKTSGNRVYASVSADKESGLYRSDDGGASWQLMKQDGSLASSYFGKITTDPVNPDIIHVTGRSMQTSIDGGKTFTVMKGSPGGDDYHYYWINPEHPRYQILASDQGTSVTVNDGRTWTPWYNQATGQFYRLAADNEFPYGVYSGQQDNGTVRIATRSDYGQLTFRDWYSVGADERDYDIPDPQDSKIVFGSGLGGRLSRWDARTGRVTNVSPWPISSYGKSPGTVSYRYGWITPIAISPRQPYALYQGAQVLFRSLDKGHSWKIISPDLSGADPKAKDCDGNVPVNRATECGYGVIHSITPSPAVDGLIWVAMENGRVRMTRDDGKSWDNVTPPDVSDWSNVTVVDASPTDPATAYIAVDRHRLDDRNPYIYRTHDSGKTWKLVTKGLPENSWVNVVRQDPVKAGLLFAGNRHSVFVSFNDGDDWQPLRFNLPTSSVNDLLIHDRDLIAATQGRALWVLDDITPLRNLQPGMPDAPILMPPAKAVRLSNDESRDTPLPIEMPTSPNPSIGAILDYFLPKDTRSISLEFVDEKGNVIRRFSNSEKIERPKAEIYFSDQWIKPAAFPAKEGHNRFVWDLRFPRPPVPKYDYSIAATPYIDTPITPEGIQVLPGRYIVRLNVDGKTFTQPLEVLADPRGVWSAADMQAQIAFYQEVSKTLSSITETITGLKAPEEKLQKRIEALTDLLTDLEGADGPPTLAQRAVLESARVP